MTYRSKANVVQWHYHDGLYHSLRNEASAPLRAWMDRRQIILLTMLEFLTDDVIQEMAAQAKRSHEAATQAAQAKRLMTQAKHSNRYSTSYRIPIGEVVLLAVLDRLGVQRNHDGVPFGYVRVETQYQSIPGLHRYAHDFKAWHPISGGAFSGEWRWVKKGVSARYKGIYTIYGANVTRAVSVSGLINAYDELTKKPLTDEHIMEWIDEDIQHSIDRVVNDEDEATYKAAQAALSARLKGLPPETASYVQDLFDAMVGEDLKPEPPAGVSAEKWAREIEHIFAKANFYPA